MLFLCLLLVLIPYPFFHCLKCSTNVFLSLLCFAFDGKVSHFALELPEDSLLLIIYFLAGWRDCRTNGFVKQKLQRILTPSLPGMLHQHIQAESADLSLFFQLSCFAPLVWNPDSAFSFPLASSQPLVFVWMWTSELLQWQWIYHNNLMIWGRKKIKFQLLKDAMTEKRRPVWVCPCSSFTAEGCQAQFHKGPNSKTHLRLWAEQHKYTKTKVLKL